MRGYLCVDVKYVEEVEVLEHPVGGLQCGFTGERQVVKAEGQQIKRYRRRNVRVHLCVCVFVRVCVWRTRDETLLS